MAIKIYDCNETDFTHNGIAVLTPKKAIVHKEIGLSAYYIDIELPLTYISLISEGLIISAPTKKGDQLFRIRSYTVTRKSIKIKADHIFFDLCDSVVKDLNVTGNGQSVLNQLKSACNPSIDFTLTADNVGVILSLNVGDKSSINALNEIANNWNCVLDVSNKDIKMQYASVPLGSETEITIEYAKNLKDIRAEYDYTNVCTKLLPVGIEDIHLDPPYLDAQGVSYSRTFCKTVQFQQTPPENTGDWQNWDARRLYLLREDLRDQATKYLNANKYPNVNYSVEALIQESVDVGDVIQVKDRELGIDLDTQVISWEFNCITGLYTSVQFGNFSNKTLSNLVNNISTRTVYQSTVNSSNTDNMITRIDNTLNNYEVKYNGSDIEIYDDIDVAQANNIIKIDKDGVSHSEGLNSAFLSWVSIDGKLNAENLKIENYRQIVSRSGSTVKTLGTFFEVSGNTVTCTDDATILISGTAAYNGQTVKGLIDVAKNDTLTINDNTIIERT